MTDEA
jgi:hypothetical protein